MRCFPHLRSARPRGTPSLGAGWGGAVVLESWWSEDCKAELRPPRVHQCSKETPDPYEGWTFPFSGLESLNLSGFAIIRGEFSPPASNNLPPAQALALLPGRRVLLVLPCLVPIWICSAPRNGCLGGRPLQTDGHGSRALAGLPLTKPGRWGLLWKSRGALSLSPVWSHLLYFISF